MAEPTGPPLGLTIQFGPVPVSLPEAAQPLPDVQISDGRALVVLDEDVRLLVTAGREIQLQAPDPGALDGDLSWIVLGWGVLLASLQRGWLALHASTVRIGGRTVAIAGLSGAGKSTTAMALHLRGHPILVDDVTPVENSDGTFLVHPFRRSVDLRVDAVSGLGLSGAAQRGLAMRPGKRAFHVDAAEPGPADLDTVVCLVPRNGDDHTADPGDGTGADAIRISTLSGVAKVQELIHHTACDGVAPAVLGQERYFDLVSQLAQSVPVLALQRAHAGWTVAEVADAIESRSGHA